jgi:hypothetical protein
MRLAIRKTYNLNVAEAEFAGLFGHNSSSSQCMKKEIRR